jgi:hypothetical protein
MIDHFTKTGSGRTQGKLIKRTLFDAGLCVRGDGSRAGGHPAAPRRGAKTAAFFEPFYTKKRHFTKTGSGQTYTETSREREREREWCVSRMQGVVDIALTSLQAYMEMPDPSDCSVRKNATFCAIHVLKRTFYQDRLGTSIGKTQKKSGVFLFR